MDMAAVDDVLSSGAAGCHSVMVVMIMAPAAVTVTGAVTVGTAVGVRFLATVVRVSPPWRDEQRHRRQQ